MSAVIVGGHKAELSRQATETATTIACVTTTVLVGAMFGILTRPVGFLAAFWPTNALLLGLFVRYPRMATVPGWLTAIIAFVVADLLAGTSLIATVWLTSANLAGVVTAFFFFRRLSEDDRFLRRPLSVLFLFVISLVASLVAGCVGVGAAEVLFTHNPTTGFSFWFATELVNYIIILPVFFTVPTIGHFSREFSMPEEAIQPHSVKYGPMLALLGSVVAGMAVGGPGAIAFPVPALLWCALTYRLFTTSVLTMLLCAWLLVATTAGILQLPGTDDFMHTVISVRLGIMLISLGPLTAASINTARNDVLRRLDRAVNHDFLTDALSRSAFMQRGKSLIAKRTPSQIPVTVLMLDIDHFKQINDTYGHAIGDRVLVAFVRTVAAVLRENDLFGRLGGEEFSVIMPRIEKEDALSIAERIREAIAQAEIRVNDGEPLHVSVSIGLATLNRIEDAELEPLLSDADAALYQAKATGRNKVVVASPLCLLSSPVDSSRGEFFGATAPFVS